MTPVIFINFLEILLFFLWFLLPGVGVLNSIVASTVWPRQPNWSQPTWIPQLYNRKNYNFRIGKYSKWKPARTWNTDRKSDLDHQSAEAGVDRAWSDFKLDRVIFGDNKWAKISNRVPRNISLCSDLIRVTVGDVGGESRSVAAILESINPSLENFR